MKLPRIQKKVYALIPTWVGEKHIPSIVRGLNKAFDKSIVSFSSDRYDQEFFVDHSVIVSGQYCPNLMFIPEQINIVLSFPKESKKAKINSKCANNLAIKIVRAIHHEYRHKHQFRQRGVIPNKYYRTKKNEKNRMRLQYYGSPDELDAHAYETQAEKLDINRLRRAHKIGWRESEAVFLYRKHFRKRDPKVWKKFLKKVYKNNGN